MKKRFFTISLKVRRFLNIELVFGLAITFSCHYFQDLITMQIFNPRNDYGNIKNTSVYLCGGLGTGLKEGYMMTDTELRATGSPLWALPCDFVNPSEYIAVKRSVS